MSRPRTPTIARALLVASLVAVGGEALARVGGGQGYSGGGGDSGFGGDGDGALAYFVFRMLLWLVFEHPFVGIPLAILAVFLVMKLKAQGLVGGAAGPTIVVAPRPSSPRPASRPRADLARLLATDPNFSEPLFTDFAQLVYARAQSARGSGREDLIAPWLAAPAIAQLMTRRDGLEAVRDVIFGRTAIARLRREGFFDLLDVEFEVNLIEDRDGGDNPYLVRERWTFRRRVGTLSPGPERMRTLGCAGCGSSAEPRPDGACPSCGAPRTGGALQWEIGAIVPLAREPLRPPSLEMGGGVEPGTTLPTVVDPDLPVAKRTFEARHPEHDWAAFERRVAEIFLAVQRAWSADRWEDARPFETDALFQTHRFWIERYRRFGLRNRVENVAVSGTHLAKIGFDAFHEAVTVRVFASALDWTEDAQGRIVGGSRDEVRTFSEYWTFLRAVGARRREDAASGSCPACAAPLEGINMAGICSYCGAKLTTGAFDWVVSRIEQDEAY